MKTRDYYFTTGSEHFRRTELRRFHIPAPTAICRPKEQLSCRVSHRSTWEEEKDITTKRVRPTGTEGDVEHNIKLD